MPKHHIYPPSGVDGASAPERIELRWQREQYVQIATTAWQGGTATTPDPGAEYLPAAADDDGEAKPAWDGRYVDLDRQRINHVIRQLRTARDQAFGRDE
jgi:hypothetical protein